MKKLSLLSLLLAVSAACAAAAFAQNTEDFSGTVEFRSPDALQTNTEFEFSFRVSNTTSPNDYGQHWIYLVEMFMPNSDYNVSYNLAAPDSLHGGGDWIASVFGNDEGDIGLAWEFVTESSSTGYGDIQESEFLDFAFVATTDDVPTDGFDWRLTSDSFEVVTGTAFIGVQQNDDDLTDDDTGCYTCLFTMECTDAFGPGWGCVDHCCVQSQGDDDTFTGDDSTAGDDADDVSGSGDDSGGVMGCGC